MKSRKRLLLRTALLLVLAATMIGQIYVLTIGRAKVVELSTDETDLIRAVVESHHQKATDSGLYFLTPTPFREWGQGGWKRFSDDFHESISGLPKPYASADEAYLLNMTVRSRLSHRNVTMRWVSVAEWRSADEAVVSDGVWRCQLGGGEITSLWKKRNGRWEWVKRLDGWVS